MRKSVKTYYPYNYALAPHLGYGDRIVQATARTTKLTDARSEQTSREVERIGLCQQKEAGQW
jgi:hypothetical protein